MAQPDEVKQEVWDFLDHYFPRNIRVVRVIHGKHHDQGYWKWNGKNHELYTSTEDELASQDPEAHAAFMKTFLVVKYKARVVINLVFSP